MKIAVIGSGTWGTSLAQVLVDNGHDVLLYAKEQSQCDDINLNHKNSFFFGPDLILPKKVKATNSLVEAIKNRPIIILVVPTKALRGVLSDINNLLDRKVTLVSTAKGFDPETDQTMSQLIREAVDEEKRNPIVSLLGPGHAEEVILRKYTIINSISKSLRYAKKIQKLFTNNYLRVYNSSDEIGCELAAGLKNGIAIGSGILDGMNQGDNARAALITRGLTEIVRFGLANGAKQKTFFGMTGLGDLIVTCCSVHSRNYQAGVQIGRSQTAKGLLESNVTIEGLRTIKTVYRLANKQNIDMPIFKALYDVIYNDVIPDKAIQSLFERPLKTERVE